MTARRSTRPVHLGFDLSDVQNGPVNAANDGKVVWAADLGIYGNCVVLDHGYALQSIYGHMRQINVKVGDMVKKGQSMGIAGQTGLGRRRPRALQHADRRRPGESARMVGRALDPRSDSIEACARAGSLPRWRAMPAPGRASPEEAAIAALP